MSQVVLRSRSCAFFCCCCEAEAVEVECAALKSEVSRGDIAVSAAGECVPGTNGVGPQLYHGRLPMAVVGPNRLSQKEAVAPFSPAPH